MKFSPLYPNMFVSEDGEVYRNGIKPLKASMSYRGGYLAVYSDKKKYYVHRLVASAYCDGSGPGKCVNHIDGNKLNNAPSNLEWITQADNVRHAFATSLMRSQKGSSNKMARFSDDDIAAVFSMRADGKLQREIASSFGMSASYVSQLLNGKRRAQ